jgi:phosphatidylinositol alpha-1,6-mannosyltransferase
LSDSGADLGRRCRVLVLTPDFPPAEGGIQRLVERIVRHFGNLEARVIALGGPGTREHDSRLPFPVLRVPALGGKRRLSFVVLNGTSLAYAARFRPDVVLSAHIVAAPATWVIGRLFSAATVQYLHADEVRASPPLARFALRSSDRVIAVSRHTRQLALGAGASPERIRIIPPGVDLIAHPPNRHPVERPTLLTVARLEDDYKGHDVVVRALPRLLQRLPSAEWVVVGGGSLRTGLETLARDLGVVDNVRFIGAASDAERDAWYDRANVFVMPSRVPSNGGGEGFGIVYLEAAMHGLPVVAGDVGGARDAVVNGETGLLVDPQSPAAVCDALVRLLEDRELAERLGRQGAARARDFGWPRIAEQVESLLIEAASERRRARAA